MKSNLAEDIISGLNSIGSFSRYLLTGGLLFLVDLLVFLVLVRLGEIEPLLAQPVSRTVGAIVGFFGHRHITFMQTRNNTRHSGATQGAAYFIVSVAMLIVTPFVLLFFLRINGGELVTAKVLTEAFAVICVYLSLKFIFAARRR
jgi:putative flippase GtrA